MEMYPEKYVSRFKTNSGAVPTVTVDNAQQKNSESIENKSNNSLLVV